MSERKVPGAVMLLLGLLIPVMQYRLLLGAVNVAGVSPSAAASFNRMAAHLIFWNLTAGVCSLALLVGGAILLLSRRRREATPPAV